MTARARHLLPALLLVVLALLAATPHTPAQQAGVQYVDDLLGYQRQIEALIEERISALVPSHNFVLKVNVSGERVRVPASGQPQAEPEPQALPGFQRAPQEPAPAGNQRWRVDQITVNLVLHEDLPDTDLQYIRTVVPILADFNPARGDRLNLRVVPQEAPGEQAAGGEEAAAPAPGAEPAGPLGLSWRDWLLLGVLGLIVLLLLVVLFRVLFQPRERPAPQPALQPTAMADVGRDARREAEERRKAEEEARKAEQQQERLNALRNSVLKLVFSRPDLGRNLVQEWQDKPDKLTTLMHALGTTVSRQALLPNMSRERFGELELSVLQEDPPDPDKQIATLREANLFLITQEFQHPEEIKADPFRFLEELSRGQVAHLVKDEPVKIKAMVLSRINPDDTARIMESMPKDMQLEVAVQIGNLHSFPLDMVENVARNLAEMARNLPDARTVDIEGPEALVELMGHTTGETSRYLLQALKAKDRKLSEEVEKKFFLFEALPMIPDDVLPYVVRQMPSDTVVKALQGADQAIQRKVIMAFPEQARPGMVNTLRAARYDEETVQDARRQLIRRVQQLANEGRIDLKQISDAWQSSAQGEGEAMAS